MINVTKKPSMQSKKPTTGTVKVAGIQMASSPQVSANLIEAERLIALAVAQGAKIVVLPEYFCIMGVKETDKVAVREKLGEGPIQRFYLKWPKCIKSGLSAARFH